MAGARGGRCLTCILLAAAVVTASASGSRQVVGGSAIQIQSAPWAVYVQQSTPNGDLACSGSIVDASHVLTAAHCLYSEQGVAASPSDMSVIAGVSDVPTPASTDEEQQRSVSSFTVQPGYTWASETGPDDVAVLALATPLDLGGAAVQAVALPEAGAAFPAGAAVGLAGFGEQTPGVTENGQLEWMTATVDAQGSCGATIGSDAVLEYDAIRLCASSPTSVPCQGDSGAGLVTTGSTPVLVGVLSGGPAGCSVGSHSVFADVAAPEILSFVQGDQQPPQAPRQVATTVATLAWVPPLVVGSRLTCASSGWGNDPVSLAYSFVNGSGEVLQSGERAIYTVAAAEVGQTIACEVAATNPGGTAMARTVATPTVRTAPPVRLLRLSPSTAARGRPVRLAVTLDVPAGLRGRVGVCVHPPSPTANPICASVAGQHGPESPSLAVSLWIKPTAPLGVARLALFAYAGVSQERFTVPLVISASSG